MGTPFVLYGFFYKYPCSSYAIEERSDAVVSILVRNENIWSIHVSLVHTLTL